MEDIDFDLLSETKPRTTYDEFVSFDRHKKRVILISGEIDDEAPDKYVVPLLDYDNDGTGEEITIYVNTPGGSLLDGLTLCDAISKLKTKTTIICLGYAYSMGSLILLAGAKNPNVRRVCCQFSTALIHGGDCMIGGSTSQVKDVLRFQERYEKRVKNFILTNSSIDETTYEKKKRVEWYLDSDEMLKYGLVDEIW